MTAGIRVESMNTPTAIDAIDMTATDNTSTVFSGPEILRRIFAFDRMAVVATAAAFTVGAVPVARLLNWPTWIVAAIGVSLIPYGLMLHRVIKHHRYHSTPASLSALTDAVWVVASVAIIVVTAGTTSTVGLWIIAAQALLVADIGLIKMLGWRRSRTVDQAERR